ncbi:MAG: co-chaperone GroES [Actinobacteria bacterium]|nr:co-chaperone GroES [Actinomycetota bacterium]
MNLKPLDDRVVVKPSEAEQTTASGLVIPDTAKEKPQQGTVLYSKYGGTEIAHKGDDLLILTSRDVLAIVSK